MHLELLILPHVTILRILHLATKHCTTTLFSLCSVSHSSSFLIPHHLSHKSNNTVTIPNSTNTFTMQDNIPFFVPNAAPGSATGRTKEILKQRDDGGASESGVTGGGSLSSHIGASRKLERIDLRDFVVRNNALLTFPEKVRMKQIE